MASEHWGTRPESGFPPRLRNDKFVHGSLAYIPPSPEAREASTFAWLEKKDYFATHPDFFSMNSAGRRVASMQLCFANPALRRELTRNILRHIAAAPGNDIITVDAADTPDAFCYCPECKALEEKYQCPGGPIFDCLIELCGLLEKEHPGKLVRTLAYRRSQTQKPPVLPGGGRLPDNLIISFAPIEDCFFADWRHPDARIQETYRDLEAWRRITSHLWAWLYPNPWGTGEVLPVGTISAATSISCGSCFRPAWRACSPIIAAFGALGSERAANYRSSSSCRRDLLHRRDHPRVHQHTLRPCRRDCAALPRRVCAGREAMRSCRRGHLHVGHGQNDRKLLT